MLLLAKIIWVIGLTFGAISWFWLVAKIFQQSFGWGIASFFIPIACLIATYLYLREVWKPLMLYLFSFLILLGGAIIAGATGTQGQTWQSKIRQLPLVEEMIAKPNYCNIKKK